MSPRWLVLLALVAGHARAQSDGWRREVGEQGQPWSEVWMADAQRDGPYTAWHPSGVLSDEGWFRGGREDGLWRSYDDEGRLVSEGQWLDGRPEGVWRFFHTNGRVAWEGAYVAGLRVGDWVERFVDGGFFRVVRWNDGEPETSREEFECRNEAGLEWRVDLEQRVEGCFDLEGRRYGPWRGFHADGTLAWAATYVDDLIDGPVFEWQVDGSLHHHGAFMLGVPVDRHLWIDEDRITVVDFGDGTGPWRDVVDGVVREDGAWEDGLRVGTWRTWSADGTPESEVVWEDGVRTKARFWRAGLVIEGGYREGLRDGRWSAWNADGKRIWEGDYVGGDRSGEWSFARADGDLALLQTFEDDFPLVATHWYVNGRLRMLEGPFERTLAWPDGVILRTDEMESGALIGGNDDADAAWENALELQAWLLADNPVDAALMATTETPRAERHDVGAIAATRMVMPIAREMPESEGLTNDNGDPNGLWTWYWSDGQRKEQATFVDGRREGLARGWDRQGHLAWQGPWLADLEDGEWLTFFANGAVHTRCFYRGGKRVGPWTSYHSNGRVATEGMYEADAETGIWSGYDERGALAWRGAYRAGVREGEWMFY